MCLIVQGSRIPLIAQKDITCYKVLDVFEGSKRTFYPMYQSNGFRYRLGQRNYYAKGGYGNLKRLKKLKVVLGEVYEGLHSYQTLEKAQYQAKTCYNVIIMKFVIPKGTEYFKGSDEDYVSLQLRLIGYYPKGKLVQV